jgi:hypothetical protein
MDVAVRASVRLLLLLPVRKPLFRRIARRRVLTAFFFRVEGNADA